MYTLDNVTSRLVGDIFSCFFLKVSRAANGQFTYAYQESLRKVCVSRRVCHRRPYVLNSLYQDPTIRTISCRQTIDRRRFHALMESHVMERIFIEFKLPLPLEDHYCSFKGCLGIRWIAEWSFSTWKYIFAIFAFAGVEIDLR